MATHSPYSNFERMILNSGPVQESIIQNLTRWDFRNLQLAGVPIPVSQAFQRKYLKPTRCNEKDPNNDEERCTNSTAMVDEIRACAGRPLWVVNHRSNFKGWIGAQDICPCLEHETFRVQYNNADDEPNTSQYPIHSKICQRCHESYAAAALANRLLAIAEFQTPLCKQHSLEQNKQSPLNACRCLDHIVNDWKCIHCQKATFSYLILRSRFFKKSIAKARIPWSHFLTRLRRFLAPNRPMCPLEGCMRQAWLEESREERMQMCMGCNAITTMRVSYDWVLTRIWLKAVLFCALMSLCWTLATL